MAGKRTGNSVGPQLSETLERVCVDAEVLVGVGKGNEQAKRRLAVAQEALDEKMDNIRGAVTMGEKVEREMRKKTHLTRRVNQTYSAGRTVEFLGVWHQSRCSLF